jgi:hypothetical protein
MELIKTIRKVDFNQYKYAYDKDAILAWKNRERELDVETLRALMYGFTFTKEYADGNMEESLFMDYWRDISFDYVPELFTEESLDEEMDKMVEDDHEIEISRENLLLQAIDSTGDGKTPETALCVIDVHQEYEYIERKFPFCFLRMTKQSVCNGIDCLYFDKNPFGIDCIYFDIKRRFEVGYPGCQEDNNSTFIGA